MNCMINSHDGFDRRYRKRRAEPRRIPRKIGGRRPVGRVKFDDEKADRFAVG